jgi:diacylglycerol kinase (ATP)
LEAPTDVPTSFGPLVLIANPRAGHGRVGQALPEIERVLQAKNLRYRVFLTTGRGDATRAARAALLAGERFLVAVGGDGTVHEVVNGMFGADQPANPNAVLGVIAAGSGCDFVKTFGLPEDAVRACDHLEGPNVFPIDVGRVRYAGDDGRENVRYFANIAEAGLGGAVVARAERLPGSFGRSRYFIGFWLTLPRYKPVVVTVQADRRSFEGRAHNVVVANCQFYGSGMKISPRSWPGDGYLDVLVMKGPKSDAFTLLPKVYRGEHLPHREIMEFRAKEIRVEAARPLRLEADGEVLGTTPATFGVLPQALVLKI